MNVIMRSEIEWFYYEWILSFEKKEAPSLILQSKALSTLCVQNFSFQKEKGMKNEKKN